MKVVLASLLLSLALAGCNASAPSPVASAVQPASTNITPPDFRMPEGRGCSGDVARWQAIQQNDLNMGHVNQKVYAEIQLEIAAASSACQAGRDAEASAMVTASKRRHGYPG